jgi:plastocyanin
MALALIVCAGAQAATKSVTLGPSSKDGKAFTKYGTDVNDFFPHSVTVRAGDSVAFLPTGFHTADFPAKGGGPLPLLTPVGTIAGENDAAGNPFWFNGLPALGFNPALGASTFGKKVAYNGSKRIESGLPITARKPMTVKFPKAGTFTYFCDVHPGMKGVVKVLGKSGKVPSAKQDAAALKKQIATDLALAKKAASAIPPAGTVYLGNAVGKGVEFFGFLPASLSVPKGTTLTFAMPVGSAEAHTATFAPGDPQKDPSSYIGKLAGAFRGAGPLPGAAIYPSDPPGPPVGFTSKSHGNGFWNSGVLDAVAASPPPSSNSVRFDEAGVFTYYCLIHPFMKGTITVTG